MNEPLEVVFFEMRGRRCALPVGAVREVAEMPHVTPVPLAGPAVRGVVQLHGQAVPLVDLGKWFSPKPRSSHYQDQQVEPLRRASEGTILIIEGRITGEPAPVRAALPVDCVLSVGKVGSDRAWEAPGGPAFVSGAVIGSEGPTLLIDPALALTAVMTAVKEVVTR
jgi:chemotaxis signal transduction protein